MCVGKKKKIKSGALREEGTKSDENQWFGPKKKKWNH